MKAMLRRGERGQSTVEFALLLPVVIIALLSVAQVGLVIYSQLTVTHTAREVARRVAVEPAIDVGQLTAEIATLRSDDARIEVDWVKSPSGDYDIVSVTVFDTVPPVSGLFGGPFGGFGVTSRAQMLVETP